MDQIMKSSGAVFRRRSPRAARSAVCCSARTRPIPHRWCWWSWCSPPRQDAWRRRSARSGRGRSIGV